MHVGMIPAGRSLLLEGKLHFTCGAWPNNTLGSTIGNPWNFQTMPVNGRWSLQAVLQSNGDLLVLTKLQGRAKQITVITESFCGLALEYGLALLDAQQNLAGSICLQQVWNR